MKSQRIRKVVISVLVLLFLGYTVPLTVIYSFQREIMYFPNTDHVGAPSEFGLGEMKVIPIKTEDGLALQDWFRPPKNGDKYTVVLFHGANVSLGHVALIARYLLKSDHGLFLCEYRGFGDSPGSPSEQGIYTDARAAVNWLTANGYPADHLVFYGSSLGTGVAVQMATETPPAMVILHSPYTRVADIAKMEYPMFPVDLLLKDRYDTIDKIGKVHAPVLILHGKDDKVIPIDNARQLFGAANHPKYFMAVEGWGHTDFFFNPVIYRNVLAWIDGQINAASH
jgi:fermentation-respiration switch protein FrsA (DUF1100 family)